MSSYSKLLCINIKSKQTQYACSAEPASYKFPFPQSRCGPGPCVKTSGATAGPEDGKCLRDQVWAASPCTEAGHQGSQSTDSVRACIKQTEDILKFQCLEDRFPVDIMLLAMCPSDCGRCMYCNRGNVARLKGSFNETDRLFERA